MSSRYEVLAHTADTGIAVTGATLAEVFENAAYGMFDLMFDLDALEASDRVAVEATGDTAEELLVDWLSSLLFEAEAGELVLCSFSVEELGEGRTRGTAAGRSSAGVVLRGPPIKAVTYHDLLIEEKPAGWRAQVIFDV